MLYYDRIGLGEEIDLTKSKNSKELIVCYYCYFNHELKFQNTICNSCHDLTMFCLNLSNIAIITVEGVDYRCIIHGINKSDAIHLSENSVLDTRGYK